MISKLLTALVLALCVTCAPFCQASAYMPDGSIINIGQFGISAHPGEDATPAVRRALEYAVRHHSSKLIFPKRRYDFYGDRAGEQYVFTSNNDEGLKRIIFQMSSMDHFEIDGQGSQFIFHGYVSPFLIDKASDITLRNFSIDWERTFHSEGVIGAVDDEGMELSFSDKYPYKIEDGLLVFYDRDKVEYPYGSLLEFDPVRRETAYMAEDYYVRGNLPAREMGPGKVKVLMPHLKGVKGDIMVFNAARRMCSAITVADSRRLEVDSVSIYHCGGMGIVAQRSLDIHIDHLAVTRNPDTDRMLSITADATHFVNCGGKLVIENSLFEGQMDDATNIHGIYVRVTKKISGSAVEVELKHEQQQGFDFIKPGNMLEVVHNTTMEAYDSLEVKAVKRVNKRYTEVTFTKLLPEALVVGKDVMASIEMYPEVIIRHCIIQKNRARGMLIGTRGKVMIEDNLFHTSGAAILFEGDGSYWFEQAGVRDVTIRSNIFDNCNYGVWGNAVIQIGSGVEKQYRNISRYNRGIKIIGNTFNVFDPRLISAYSVQNLSFLNNKINTTQAYPNRFPNAHHFEISDCSGVKIQDASDNNMSVTDYR